MHASGHNSHSATRPASVWARSSARWRHALRCPALAAAVAEAPTDSPPLPFGDSDAPPDCPVPGPPALVMAPSEGHDESQSHTTPVSWRGGGGRTALLFPKPVNCNPPFICSSTAQSLRLPAMVRLPSDLPTQPGQFGVPCLLVWWCCKVASACTHSTHSTQSCTVDWLSGSAFVQEACHVSTRNRPLHVFSFCRWEVASSADGEFVDNLSEK
jgi:hypothetical protein